MITFTPLSSSAHSPSTHATRPISYLLELDDIKILLDLGGSDPRVSNRDDYDTAYERRVKEIAPTISLLLLSHSPTHYTSLYPYARAHWGLKCPVYATQPTVELGRLGCLEEVAGWRAEVEVGVEVDIAVAVGVAVGNGGEGGDAEETFKGPFMATEEQVNEAFDQIKAIRYSQPIHLSGLLSHLLLTPYPSGQTLGGSLFKLRSPTSGTLLYALGLNHTSERHLSGTVLLSSTGISEGGLGRPDLLLVEGGRSKSKGGGKMKDKIKGLLDLVSGTLEVERKDLVFPVDGSGRLLELLLLLDQHWAYQVSQSQQQQQQQQQRHGPGSGVRKLPWDYPLCLVSRTGEEGVRVARSLMEWMGGTVANDEGLGSSADNANARGKRRRLNTASSQPTKEEETVGQATMGALRFRYVRFFASIRQYEQAVNEMGWEGKPKCVLAVPMSMEYGFSRRLFVATAGKRGCKIVLTGRSERGTLGQDLFERWEARQVGEAKYGMGKVGEPVRLSEEEDDGDKGAPRSVRMKITLNDKVPLEGEELEAHLQAEREKKEKELAAVAAKERSRRMLEADDLESDSDDDDDDENGEGGEGAGGIGVGGADTLGGIEDDSIRPGPLGGTGLSSPFVDPDDVRNTSFDIYVKGQQVRSTGFFKNSMAGIGGMNGSTPSGLARFRMFPFVERKGRRVDVYGEGIDVGAWVRKGREIEEDQESDEVKEAKRKQKEEEEKAKEPPEPPSKYVQEELEVQVECDVFYVDMEGQHDGRAIKTIIPQLNPRQLIILRSYKEATEDLLLNLQAINNLTKEISAPADGESVVIGEQTQSYSISLSEGLMGDAQGRWSKFEDYEVAKVSGKVHVGANMSIPVLELPIKDEEQAIAEATTLVVKREEGAMDVDHETTVTIPPTKPPARSTPSALIRTNPSSLPQTLFIGDLRLNTLKSRLSSMSIPAEFAGEGLLICGPGVPTLLRGDKLGAGMGSSVVAVRKTGEGKIEMEGALGEVYYHVREALYGNFAQVVM